jgi:hypothetical protein
MKGNELFLGLADGTIAQFILDPLLSRDHHVIVFLIERWNLSLKAE